MLSGLNSGSKLNASYWMPFRYSNDGYINTKIENTGNKSKSPYKNLKYVFSYYGTENILRRSGNKNSE